MKYKAVFFDFDGTVADTLLNITAAVNHSMEHFGLRSFSPEELKPHLGWGVDHLMRRLRPDLPEARISELLAFYRPYYAAHTTEQVVPYPGILPMLERLHQAGLPLAIVSNKPDPAVQPLMERDFRGPVSLAVGELPGIPRKPAPDLLAYAAGRLGVELSGCLYVGDTEVDLQTARNMGIDCICVSWGFRSREELLRAGAGDIADSPQDLLELILH